MAFGVWKYVITFEPHLFPFGILMPHAADGYEKFNNSERRII